MIRTKVQADALVSNTLRNLTTKQDKLLRGYQFAKIYYDVKDLGKAEEHISGFLTVKNNYAPAYKLLGQISEATNLDRALAAYKKSFELDSSQKDILLKVCELMEKCNVDANQAKFWSEKAEKFFPSNETIFNLKARAKETQLENSSNSNNANELINFYEAECTKFPKDLARLMKLLKLYKSAGRVEEAFKKIAETEMLHHSLEWYQCVIEVLSEYKKSRVDEKMPVAFLQYYLLALNHLASLAIEQSLSISSASEALWRLDQELLQYADIDAASFDTDEELFKVLINEIGAQYVFLCGVLLLNKAQKDDLNWQTSSDLSYACFLASQSQSPPNTKENWFKRASCEEKKFFERLYKHACFRCSQTGHILRKNHDDESNGPKWLNRIQEEYLHPAGIKRICQILFSRSGNASQDTFLFKSSLFSSAPSIPEISSLKEWDGVVQLANPGNLAALVWICLHYYSRVEDVQPEYPFVLFAGLSYGAQDLDSCGLESLSQLDVQCFLMAAVRCSALVHHERFLRQDPNRPFLLPLYINENLCSKAQIEWWSALNKYYNSSSSIDRAGHNRSILLQGIEVVRLIGNHGMDVKLVVHLARNWAHKVDRKRYESDSELELYDSDSYLQKLAKHYWSKAKEMIEKLLNKQSLIYPKICMFESRSAPSQYSDVAFRKYLNEGKLFLSLLMKNSDRDDALKMLNSVKSADSLYHTGLIYKEMAADNSSFSDDTLEENKNEQIILLTKAEQAFRGALEMGADDDGIPSEEITNELKHVEAKLSHLQVAREYEFGDDSVSSVCFTPQKTTSDSHKKSAGFMASSTPFSKPNRSVTAQTPKSKTSSYPSSEEFKAQLDSLTHYVDQRFKLVSDENQRLLEKVIALEHKVVSLESQKLTWTPTIPLHLQGQMVPATHPSLAHYQQLPVLQGNQMKTIPDIEFANRFHAPMVMDKFNPSIHPNVAALHQRIVAPGYNPMPSLLNFRPPPAQPDVLKSQQDKFVPAPIFYPADRENIQDLPENSIFRGLESIEAMLPVIQPGFFSQHHPATTTVAASGLPCTIAGPVTSSPQRGTTSLAKLLGDTASKEGNTLTIAPTSKKNFQGVPTTEQQAARESGISSQVVASDSSNLVKISQPPVTSQSLSSTGASKKMGDATPKKVINHKNKTSPQTSSSLFSNFSFGLPASDSATSKPVFKFPQAFVPPVNTLKSLAASVSSAKSPLKENLNLSTEKEEKQDESVEEFEPLGNFMPLVSLPIVNVVTGEEDEVKLFGERGKLYRMDTDVKQWKERGSGEVKILQNNECNKFRIIMRRDQVHKVCANHYITKDMRLESMDSSENSFCWFAQDFAEEEAKKENFCLKFKTKDIAVAFKDCFESCQKKLSATKEMMVIKKSGDTRVVVVKSEIPNKTNELVESKPSLSEMFKSKQGEWECNNCYVKNLPTSFKCVSCECPKPGTEKASDLSQQKDPKMTFGPQGGFQLNSSLSTAGKFSFTGGIASSSILNSGSWSSPFGTSVPTSAACELSQKDKLAAATKPEIPSQKVKVEKTQPNLSEVFKLKQGEWECNDCYVKNDLTSLKCVSCECPKPGTKKALESSRPIDPKMTVGPQGGFQFRLQTGLETSIASSCPSTTGGFTFTGGFAPPSTLSTGSWSSPFGTSVPSTSTNVFANAASLATSTSMISSNFSISSLFSVSSTPLIFTSNAAVTTSNLPVSFPVKFTFPAPSSGSFNFPKPVFTLSSSVNSSPLFGSSKPVMFSFNKSNEAADKSSNASTSTTFTTLSSISFAKTKFEEGGKNVVAGFATPEKKVGGPSSRMSLSFGTPTFTFAGISNNIDVKTPSLGLTPQSPQSPEDEMYANVEGEDDHIRFEPVVKLPDNFDLVTGEENEAVLFCEDAKMYRFVKDEWKEKGSGKVKLLKNLAGKVRVLMRREKVHKICCNHFIMANMQLQAMPSSKNKAWIWYANDFTEGDGSYEQLCIKFKAEEQAADFKKVFEDSVKNVKMRSGLTDSKQEDSEDDCVIVHTELPSLNHISEANRYSLPDSFYNYLNAPGCPGCIGCDEDRFVFSSVNLQDTSVKKEDAKAKDELGLNSFMSTSSSSILPSFSTKFSFSTPSTSSSTFAWMPKSSISVFQSSVTPSSAMSASMKVATPVSETTKLFGTTVPSAPFSILSKKPQPCEEPSALESESKTLSSANMFGFGSTSGCMTFASMASSSTTSSFSNVTPTVDARKNPPAAFQTSDATPNIFGSSSKFVDFTSLSSSGGGFQKDTRFSWQGAGQKLFSSPAVTSPRSDLKEPGNDDDDEVVPSSADNIHFEPIVNLPVVDTKTGEEDEDEVYKQRCNLYRFDGGQWKERGVGDMKILQNKSTGSSRLLFRREQIHKVVCNHLLTADINFEPMNTSEKAWCWFANDFSDGEARMEQFAVRFKTIELAKEFKAAIDGNKSSHVKPTVAKVTEVNPHQEGHIQEYEEEVECENEDGENAAVFEKRATLLYKDLDNQNIGPVTVTIEEDFDVSGYRVSMLTDGGETVCNHIICSGYRLERPTDEKKNVHSCSWTAKDYSTDEPVRKTFILQFSSRNSLDEFMQHFNEGTRLAAEQELTENRQDEYVLGQSSDVTDGDED